MKICACIAEYNPFHNGHLKHIEYIKNTLRAEKLIVIMSGAFCQRGEPAVLDKWTRAKHAILAGADMVVELPTLFATANAEVFAKGAVKIIDALGIADGLCFGVESGKAQDYIALASAMNNETKEFKRALKKYLDEGVSLAKAKFLALKDTEKNSSLGEFDDLELISYPNNILALEYTKALLSLNSKIDIYPMLRTGDHNDVTLKKGVTSATSIRSILKQGKTKGLKGCVPKYVFCDLECYPFAFDKITLAKILATSAEELEKAPDCTEGLENRIKALAKDSKSVDVLVDKVSTKRYTTTRVRRILTANLLGITKGLVSDCLNGELYAKVLAVRSDCKELISLVASKSKIPLLTRKSDESLLSKTAKKCFAVDLLANDLYNLVTEKSLNDHQMIIV